MVTLKITTASSLSPDMGTRFAIWHHAEVIAAILNRATIDV